MVLRTEEQSRVADTFGALSGIRSVVANDEDRPAWSERTDCPPQHAPALLGRKVEEQAEYEVGAPGLRSELRQVRSQPGDQLGDTLLLRPGLSACYGDV